MSESHNECCSFVYVLHPDCAACCCVNWCSADTAWKHYPSLVLTEYLTVEFLALSLPEGANLYKSSTCPSKVAAQVHANVVPCNVSTYSPHIFLCYNMSIAMQIINKPKFSRIHQVAHTDCNRYTDMSVVWLWEYANIEKHLVTDMLTGGIQEYSFL